MPAALLEWWKVVLEHTRWHEEQHVRIFAEHYARLPSMVAGRPCESWSTIVDAWMAEMLAAQEAFHAVDASWRPPVYRGP